MLNSLIGAPYIGGDGHSSLRTRYSLSDENSELEPPDPIPNSEVKRLSADGSVGSPHVRVGHRQAFILNALVLRIRAFFLPRPLYKCQNLQRF